MCSRRWGKEKDITERKETKDKQTTIMTILGNYWKAILNKWVFRAILKQLIFEILRMWYGNWFHKEGPACANDRSPHDFLDFGTASSLESEDLKRRGGLYGINKLTLYSGADPWIQWKTNNNNLNTIRNSIGNQCSEDKTGVMWVERLIRVTIRAAEFCNFCKRESWDCGSWNERITKI